MRFSYGTPNMEQPATRSHMVTIEDILCRTSGSHSEVDVPYPKPPIAFPGLASSVSSLLFTPAPDAGRTC